MMSPDPRAEGAESGRDLHPAAAWFPEPPDPLRNLWWLWRPRPGGSFDHTAADGAPPAGVAPVGATAFSCSALPAAGHTSPADLAALRAYLDADDTWFHRRLPSVHGLRVAYFCAEFGLLEPLPVYAGGLGVLAGDHLKSASDLGVPLVGVGLLYREGYFTQRVDADGWQTELYRRIEPESLPLTLERRADGKPLVVSAPFLDHRVHAQVWRLDVGRVPLYLLDTDIPQNSAEDRRITDRLYGGDIEHRLRQEIVLGICGMRALAALGRTPTVLHLNEGHAAFAAVERVRQAIGGHHGVFHAAAQRLRDGVVFTTHTPVPAGHDVFPPDLMERYLGGYVWEMREPWDRFLALGRWDPSNPHEPFNMTLLALRLAGHCNGVSRLHGAVSRRMFRGVWPEVPEDEVPITHVTNGVHLATWVAPPMARLYEEHIGPAWRDQVDDIHWHAALHLPLDALWRARCEQRAALVARVRERLAEQCERRGDDAGWTTRALDPDVLTIGFARRFATYKRATLLLTDEARLERMIAAGNVQFIFAGKAHPHDDPGREFLHRVFRFAARPDVRERFVFLEDYDLAIAHELVAGADVWLNVPRRPREASATSGMKAAANGALNLSIPDGWWAEAWAEHNALPHPIGWCIETEEAGDDEEQDRRDAEALYGLLETEVIPLFYRREGDAPPIEWCERIRASIRQILPYFNTHRMVAEYTERFYATAHEAGARRPDAPAPGTAVAAS
jgi:starch phosphorylase|nr:MAG: alpha-glucan phosphorylase [bacterium]